MGIWVDVMKGKGGWGIWWGMGGVGVGAVTETPTWKSVWVAGNSSSWATQLNMGFSAVLAVFDSLLSLTLLLLLFSIANETTNTILCFSNLFSKIKLKLKSVSGERRVRVQTHCTKPDEHSLYAYRYGCNNGHVKPPISLFIFFFSLFCCFLRFIKIKMKQNPTLLERD